MFGLLALFLGSCNDSQSKLNISAVNVDTHFQRFDSAFFNLDTATAQFIENLDKLKQVFPPFFMSNETDRFWRFQRLDGRQNELYKEVESSIRPFSKQDDKLNLAMKHLHAAFPEHEPIKVYSYISNLDFDLPTFYNDSIKSCFVATDLYLGANKPYYEFLPNYIAYYRQPAFMVRDAVESVLQNQIDLPSANSELLDDMIYHGKILYALECILPNESPSVIIKYKEEQLAFCKEK